MTTVQVRLIETGLFLLLMFLSGFWLSRAGKPYPGGKFNLHKFIGLGTGAFLIVMVYRAQQAAPLSAVQVTAVAITVLLFIINVIAGGLVSPFQAHAGSGQADPQSVPLFVRHRSGGDGVSFANSIVTGAGPGDEEQLICPFPHSISNERTISNKLRYT